MPFVKDLDERVLQLLKTVSDVDNYDTDRVKRAVRSVLSMIKLCPDKDWDTDYMNRAKVFADIDLENRETLNCATIALLYAQCGRYFDARGL